MCTFSHKWVNIMFGSFLSLMHMSTYKKILFSMTMLSKLCHFRCTEEDDCDTTQSVVSIHSNSVVLRISSSKDQTMMDDTENIQGN